MSLKFSYLRRTMWLYATLALMILVGGVASASMPPAGYVIGNQAAAQYLVDGQTFKVTSNLVETEIAQKAALTLTNTQSTSATPGLSVYFSHQITNTGNATDSYNLTTAVVSGGLTNVAIYPDVNADGIPDETTTPITVTPSLTQGETYNVVVMATVPTTATVGSTGSLTITATSNFDSTQTVTNTDTINVVNQAVMQVTKSFDKNSAKPGDTLKVTLTYRNVGTQAAGKFELKDTLPTGLTYVAGSGLWSLSGTTALNDTNSGNPTTPNGGINYTVSSNVITADFSSVPLNQVATLTFNVTVAAGTLPGVINNSATFDYNPTGGSTLPGTPTNTNNAVVTIDSVPGVVATDSGSTTDQDGAADGTVTMGLTTPVYAGGVVLFDNVITNTGNGIDTFNIEVSANTFPAGTSFTLTKADGITPLTDSNGDGIPDTGLLNPGASYHVFLRVQLPSTLTGFGPFQATKTATSITSSSVTSSVIDKVASITAAQVDLTNTTSGTDGGLNVADGGWGPGPETVPQTTVTAAPGTTATFDLYINHTAPVVGSYLLQYSNTSSFASGTINSMPAGWNVEFVDATTSATLTSATVNASSGSTATQYHYKAIVTVPASAAAGNNPIYFRVISNALGISDIKYDQVTVSTVHDIAIQPNNVAQVYAGDYYVYTHLLQNLGNVTETSGTVTVTNTGTASGWTATAYLDSNGNGVFDPGTDAVFTNLSQITGGLAAGASVNVFVKVQAPAGALAGDNSVTSVTIQPPIDANLANNTVQDQTTVISGFVTVLKQQFADPACSTTPSTSLAYVTSTITTLKPGECVIYSVTATNNGTAQVSSLSISDTTPTYTTLNAAISTGGTTTSTPTINSAGTVGSASSLQVTWPTIAPGATAILFYRVQINSS